MPQYQISPKLLLDSISGHLKSKLDGNGVPSKIELRWHLDLILDALISNLAIILARFYIRAGPILSKFDYMHLGSILATQISVRVLGTAHHHHVVPQCQGKA
jgi:hypothetical protein